jgi:ribonuclease HI
MSTLPFVTIYTDGACDPNPGPGGWAAVLRFGEHEKELKGAAPHTTNNRMELQAVIGALNALKQPCAVRLHTDSQYVQRGVTEWLTGWKAKGWKKVQNRDLWEALDAALQRHTVEWQWVRGHAGDALNERVDRLAVSMIPRSALPLDDAEATHVFTGVSCLGQAGPGAWAVIVRTGVEATMLVGREEKTSANRLHLLAALKGLESVTTPQPIHLYTPSDYAAQGAQQWARAWAAQGWRTKDGKPVKHSEVWQAIVKASAGRGVKWHGLKDEIHPPESQQAETLAQEAARATQ